ncbi:hypothetical protein ACLMJK_002298 [Lecanora helva]
MNGARPCEYPYWTILNLTPEGFGKQEKAVGHMDVATLSLVADALKKVADRWSELVVFLQALLENDDALLDPVRHDHLLFDNEDFSKSREYFWAINCLTEFDASMSANIEHWEGFRLYLGPFEDSGKESWSNLDDRRASGLMKKSDEQCTRLKRYQRFFQDKRKATIALRNGLFNASSVMESRASTRLGENIRLPTFVSVFFLPLSFCTSIWSTQNGPSNPKTMAYVCVIVGLVTYLIVFNLDFVARKFSRSYENFKVNTIRKMRREQNEAWRQLGRHYDFFRPTHDYEKPTDWYFLLYMLRRAFFWPWRSTPERNNDVDFEADDAET